MEELEFLLRFTVTERIAIENMAETDDIIRDLLFLLDHTESIHLDNPQIIQALNYFQVKGIVTEQRKQEILGAELLESGDSIETVTLITNQPVFGSSDLYVVEGGVYRIDELVNVTNAEGDTVAFHAKYIATGENI